MLSLTELQSMPPFVQMGYLCAVLTFFVWFFSILTREYSWVRHSLQLGDIYGMRNLLSVGAACCRLIESGH